MTIGMKLRIERTKRKLRLVDVAEKVFINHQALSHYERDTSDIPARVFIRLCKFYDLKLEDFKGME